MQTKFSYKTYPIARRNIAEDTKRQYLMRGLSKNGFKGEEEMGEMWREELMNQQRAHAYSFFFKEYFGIIWRR